MVHVGFAISKRDEEEAARTYQYLEEMNQLGEIPSNPDTQGSGTGATVQDARGPVPGSLEC